MQHFRTFLSKRVHNICKDARLTSWQWRGEAGGGGGRHPSKSFGRGVKVLEGLKSTSQQTILAVLKERMLILLSSTDVMCIKNHCSVPLLHAHQISYGFQK